ncbi:unnamed protein product [Brassicogethes aeneus]|uniref:Multidrug resistance-associated protein lethal(2)03659 n=1 Tax=Brassicogethes aeneus TaxID=1431903 RepID=A0A9P0B9D2_BRAAE|nr:unnamed protein product [Brassicogethes aeneus]
MEEVNFKENKLKYYKIHPKKEACWISQIFLCWFFSIFYKGYRKGLTEDDLLGTLKEHESAYLGNKLEKAWINETLHNTKPSLWNAIKKVFRKYFLVSGCMFIIVEFVIKLAQPLLLSRLMAYYVPNQTAITKNEAFLYAFLIFVFIFLRAIFVNGYNLYMTHLGLKIRVAACSLIYRKAMKLSTSSLVETTVGKMVNLLSNDVTRFESLLHIHSFWGAPLESIVILVLLYDRLGFTSITGLGLFLCFIPLQSWMGKKNSVYRLKTALKTDERVRLMNEIITGIQVIKMYAWEKSFARLVQASRLAEMKYIRRKSMLQATSVSLNLIMNRFAIYLCVITYVLFGNSPDHQYVFVCTSFYGMLQSCLTNSLPKAITQMAEFRVSIKRLNKFLMLEEIHYKDTISKNKDIGVYIQGMSAKWAESSPDNVLNNIDFRVKSKELIGIIGPVGCGKTTLLNVILQEIIPSKGTIDISGQISYSSQEPWLFGSTVRQNILFGLNYDEKKYIKVIRACALERDLSLFQYGDKTLVGERGVILSGGQRARINLARAVYKDADIYLLDDPLSAVDTHVGRQLFDDCIKGYLQNKCVVLITHQLQYLRSVDKIYLLENGNVTISGTYEDLQKSDIKFTDMLIDSKEDESVEKNDREVTKYINNNTKEEKQVKEHMEKGSIKTTVYKTYISSGGGYCKWFTIIALFFICMFTIGVFDYFITFWVNLEQFKNMNHTSNFTFNDTIFSEEICMIIYSILLVLLILVIVTRTISFYRFCNSASSNMHNLMFKNVVHATMRFFNTNPSGRILNRFSKDINVADETIPLSAIETFQSGLQVLGASILITSLNTWILIPTILMFTLFYFLRRIFIKSSRMIKRIEGTTRSPVFTHFSASIQGLTTIRAFRAEDILQKEFDNFQNIHSAAHYMFMTGTRTFGIWLDLICAFYVGFVTLNIFFIENETYGGNVGLTITQALSMCGKFQWGLRQWSQLENHMTSIERISEYIETKTEQDGLGKVRDVPKLWPDRGTIKFDGVYFRYSESEPYVLKGVNLEIRSEEKIGIVGRTGAGKSSLIFLLFKLAKFEGSVFIDNIDSNEISLVNLRSKISIIPQEPVLFSGTLRKNLDPFEDYNDDILWNALNKVELKAAITELPLGLQSTVCEAGLNFSVGQRQLICLARALIRKNKILILDEATANVDPHTDALIQTTIREKFSDCTVLTIAHRLHTIMDSDRVLVMDEGCIKEFDSPYILLKNTDGYFYSLVSQTGKSTTKNFIEIAEKVWQIFVH